MTEAAVVADRLGGWAIAIIAGAFGFYLRVKVTRRQLFLRQLRIARISPDELAAKLTAGEAVFIVDLRHEVDVQAEPIMIPGAVHMAPAALEQGLSRSRETAKWCSTVPDRTKPRAPGWRSCCAGRASRASGPWQAGSRPGATVVSRWRT